MYESPEVNEYGQVESLTQQKDKCGTSEDDVNAGVGLTGSIVDTGEC